MKIIKFQDTKAAKLLPDELRDMPVLQIWALNQGIREEDHDCSMKLKGYCRGCETVAEVLESFNN